MLRNHRFALLFVLVTAVFTTAVLAVTAPAATAQPLVPPPRPERSLEQFPRLPGAATEWQPTEPNTDRSPTSYWYSSSVYQSYLFGNWNIYRNRYDEGQDVVLSYDLATDIQPRLNRGATQVAFVSNRSGAYEIYRVNIDDSGLTRLTFTNSDHANPAWSPDSSKIAFQSYRDGQSEIYVMNADGSNQTRLTQNPEFDGMPTWSPDGSKIAFASYRNGGYRIYVMNADGSGVAQLSAQPYSANPTWSPDGTKIAYDADLDGDGWQELWLMNADGSNQQLRYDPPGQTDAWARSWSADNAVVHYTLINFTYYQNNWYWVDAYLETYHVDQGSIVRQSSSGLDWNPDWQTADLAAPVSNINPLPAQSIYQFFLYWTGQDVGPAGISGYDLRYKIGANGTWVYLSNNMGGGGHEFNQGIGGQTYYFQIRAHDQAGNVEAWKSSNQVVTTIENQPPQTAVTPLAPFTRANEPIQLDWNGVDFGGSGIAEYEVQYRAGSGSWVSLGTFNQGPVTFDDLPPGETYYFRVRGTDRAQNQESWAAGNGDTSTTVYATAIRGVVQDNSGTPIEGITLTTNPASFYTVSGDENGRYATFLATQPPTFTSDWAKNGYGPLPTTTFPGLTDAYLPIVLPPADNVIGNSGFETGAFAPAWLPGGSALPVITTTARHTGEYAALFSQGGESFNNGRFLGTSSSGLLLVKDNDQTLHAAWIHNGQLMYTQRAANNWLPPQSVTNNVAGEPIHLAADNLSTLHLIWQTSTGIYYAQKPQSGSWSSPQFVSNRSRYLSGLQMNVSGSGIVHVIWDSTGGDIYYQQRNSNGTWTAAQNISNSPEGTSPIEPKMVVDSAGNVHVVWNTMQANRIDIFYLWRPVGGSWSTPLNISNSPQHSTHTYSPNLIVAADGTVHVVWQYSGDLSLYHTRRTTNGNWSAPYKFTDEVSYSFTYLAVDDDDTLYVVFGPEYNQYVSKRNPGGVWSSEELSLHFTGDNIQALIDSSGLAHVVYQDSDSSEAYYVRQIGSGGWTPPLLLEGDAVTNTFFNMQMLMDSFGQAHILWRSAYGNTYYAGPEWATTADTFTLTHFVTVPLTMTTPTLSFLYQAEAVQCGATSCLSLELDNGAATTPLWSLTETHVGWNHQSINLSLWAGQAISLTFRLEQTANTPMAGASLDEVTLGAAHPDVWVMAEKRNGIPNDQIVHTLTYGNRGGAVAAGTRLTYTLPAELAFVSASLTPVATSPLVWELGDLAASDEPMTLSVVVQIEPTAVAFSTLTSTAVIHSTSAELETINNSAQGQTYIARLTYLPLIAR